MNSMRRLPPSFDLFTALVSAPLVSTPMCRSPSSSWLIAVTVPDTLRHAASTCSREGWYTPASRSVGAGQFVAACRPVVALARDDEPPHPAQPTAVAGAKAVGLRTTR